MNFLQTVLAMLAALLLKDAGYSLWQRVPAGFDWRGWAAWGATKAKPVANAGAMVLGYGVLALVLMQAGRGCTLPPLPPIPWPVPPGPAPTPQPPTPAPIEIDGFAVLIVEESGDRAKLTIGQHAAMFGKTCNDYLDEKCAADPYGKNTKAHRILDKDVSLAQIGAAWEKAMKRPRASVPWLVVSHPKRGGFEGPLPEKEEDTIALLKKFGD